MIAVFPPTLYPASEELTLVDDTTSVFQSKFGAGLTQRVTRIGPRWQLSVKYERLSQQDRHNLMAFISQVRGKAIALMYSPRHSTFRGAFPAEEEIGNVTFDSVSGWSVSSQLGLYADGNRLRLTRTSASSDVYAYAAQLTGLTSGAAYLFRCSMYAGDGGARWNLRCGSSAGATTYFSSSTYTTDGHGHASGTIGATTAYASIGDYYSGRSTSDYQIADAVSFARCIRVNGASQTGNALNVKNLPTSTNGLLVRGDIVAVYTTQWELKRVTAALNSDGSGLGYLQFESDLRASPADSAPIAVHRPQAKFVLMENAQLQTRPGMYSDFDLRFMEIIEP